MGQEKQGWCRAGTGPNDRFHLWRRDRVVRGRDEDGNPRVRYVSFCGLALALELVPFALEGLQPTAELGAELIADELLDVLHEHRCQNCARMRGAWAREVLDE